MTCQILDITRTVSRVGRGFPTGIDRVEHAYIKEFLQRFSSPLFIAKIRDSYFVINAETMEDFVNANMGDTLKGIPKLNDALRLKIPRSQRQARSFLKKRSFVTFHNEIIKDALRNCCPKGFTYTNVGHSNLSMNFLSKLKTAGCIKNRIMVHDMIPLDYPEYCREKTPQEFEDKMKSVAVYADQIICNSKYTKSRVQSYFQEWNSSVTYLVAYLGVEKCFEHLDGPKSEPISFVALGTIEPRKNHVLLLDVWEELTKRLDPDDMPVLYIVGKRGWNNDMFFKRLDASPLLGKYILEYGSLGDKELNEILNNASALLFPSFVEGYGLPALEAITAGLPVVCSDIPVFNELFDKQSELLPADDFEIWTDHILDKLKCDTILKGCDNKYAIKPEAFSWRTHFRHVFEE